MSLSAIPGSSAVTYAYQTQVHNQTPAKPAHNQPTDTIPQEDRVQLSSAAKSASGDVDRDGDSR